ncbi:ImmA/IrrE family metallo-endopeptidase [Marinifilum flexuosum]|uniref:ImmA/IrrE family metallo-endopeptidase n=1 Tax=Marinifilum flexuosum TaxID=1117708 RepID=UPI002492D1D8|nr:ImmA/IrrE family metallo-endopeptidase [Marinifilum flexuosum]
MAKKSILKRGFKTNCEKKAKQLKQELGIRPHEPLCAFNLAKHIGIPVYKATEFITCESEIQLLAGSNGTPCEWSALTMTTEQGNQIIIHNPFSTSARQQSDLMHEIAHILCGHKHQTDKLPINLPFGLREFNELQEEEAKCLGSTLQLSRESLLWARRMKMSKHEISDFFNSSIEMVTYRLNTTAVDKQLYFRNKVNK